MPARTDGILPDLLSKVQRVLAIMEIAGHPMKMTDGFRTAEEQAALYAKGRTAPGKIVTYVDGVTKKSNHQLGRAIDCAFKGDQPYGEKHPWMLYGLAAEAVGLEWGGRWKRPDRPHVELPEDK